MMQLTSAMVGMLQGNALMVLTVLMLERGPRSLSFICDMTNMSDKTASKAVRKLKTLGMITENGRYIYQIADGIMQLPLPAEELPEPSNPEHEAPVDKPVDKSGSGELGRKISDLALNESMNQGIRESEINLDSLIDSGWSGKTGAVTPILQSVTRAELEDFGFYGRGLADLLKIQGLTEGEVRYQVEHAPSLGAALARIRKRQPVPRTHERDGPRDDRRKYIEGELADYIEH